MKFTVLVENMYLQEDTLIESWIHESGGDARTMLQKFKDWVKSMVLRLINVIGKSINKFLDMVSGIWTRGIILARRIVGKITKEEYERDKEYAAKYHKAICDSTNAGHEAISRAADRLRDGEYETVREAYKAGCVEFHRNVDKVFEDAGLLTEDMLYRRMRDGLRGNK